jgi:hypothetical protein
MVDSPLNEAHKNGLCDIKIKLHNKNTLASMCGSKIALRYSHHGNLRFSVRPDDERNFNFVGGKFLRKIRAHNPNTMMPRSQAMASTETGAITHHTILS